MHHSDAADSLPTLCHFSTPYHRVQWVNSGLGFITGLCASLACYYLGLHVALGVDRWVGAGVWAVAGGRVQVSVDRWVGGLVGGWVWACGCGQVCGCGQGVGRGRG